MIPTLGDFAALAIRGGLSLTPYDVSNAYINADDVGSPDLGSSSAVVLRGQRTTALFQGLQRVRTVVADKSSSHGPHLNTKQLRRILTARESIFKYGIYLPKNDRDADASPERARWYSGRQLEWLRLKEARAFEYDWTLPRMLQEFPDYSVKDIGHCFYIYDYKFSGEHRVRLVFDGSRQSPSTYDDTYAPTVRPESIRLFHVYAVEMGWPIHQFDVPQAFLQLPIDHTIFVYPPRPNVEHPGQLLKLRLALYGAKQSAALFFKLLNGFLLTLGFESSTFDACFYKRHDALIIVHVDDMRVTAQPDVLQQIHAALYGHFQITTSDGSRFLGMDSTYDLSTGVLTMGMTTYIQLTLERFNNFDMSRGCPYREIVGCLLWIVLCVVGPELLRVKDLARRSNNPTTDDYLLALKTLKRIAKLQHAVIIYKRFSAGCELIPLQTRPDDEDSLSDTWDPTLVQKPQVIRTSPQVCPLPTRQPDPLDILDIEEVPLPTNSRFSMTAYTDAAFAVGELKISISGFVIYVNCTPILWGSMTQTVGADSTCSAEFVAASICCKQLIQVENMFRFLGFLCPKPYRLYTDSQASLSIASNSHRMGQIRHISIRYHLFRSLVCLNDVFPVYCVTEDMIADLFTKILVGGRYARLSARFYYIGSFVH
jgi:hypothetical protein